MPLPDALSSPFEVELSQDFFFPLVPELQVWFCFFTALFSDQTFVCADIRISLSSLSYLAREKLLLQPVT